MHAFVHILCIKFERATFRVINSALAIFPSFLRSGVIYDLIIEKQSAKLSWKIAVVTLVLMIASAGIILYL
jgi:hypothetical protein